KVTSHFLETLSLVAMLAIFAIICLYGMLASLVNSILSETLIPTTYPCFIANSRETSGLLKIAKSLENNGVCGIPTDTVYALAASCKNPSAIEKIYSIKVHACRKATQYSLTNHQTPVLLSTDPQTFLSGISCIVPKGEWLLKLAKSVILNHFQDSIMIRVPDHTATAHLCEFTGPLAITSANPSGEADSTYHDMICIPLLIITFCSFSGTISILREGCVPALKVRQIFERVKSNML
uniref:Threonylcarbamoyl-AMP synthase n=1 Tax=Sinocyclocheilus anshuiensis TaxID=1608454 RepID=A0A671M340_9TELE